MLAPSSHFYVTSIWSGLPPHTPAMLLTRREDLLALLTPAVPFLVAVCWYCLALF